MAKGLLGNQALSFAYTVQKKHRSLSLLSLNPTINVDIASNLDGFLVGIDKSFHIALRMCKQNYTFGCNVHFFL